MSGYTDQELLAMVKKDGRYIEDIKNPTEEMKLEAVKQNWVAIRSIENPSEEVILYALKSNGEALKFIENPTKDQISIAVTQSIRHIKYINDDFGLYNMNIIRDKWGTYEGKLITCEFDGLKFVLAGCHISTTYEDFSGKLTSQTLEYPSSFNEVDVENVLKEIELFFE